MGSRGKRYSPKFKFNVGLDAHLSEIPRQMSRDSTEEALGPDNPELARERYVAEMEWR